ncbi:protein of unknown function [Pararobbsia alpina]|uniref:hypothetical protein n=1 Tax=Pararobbsia alpina TaxID=621374 RepID=UPI0039A64089
MAARHWQHWQGAARAAAVMAGLAAIPVEGHTQAGDDVTMPRVLPDGLTSGKPRPSFDPAQRNISDPPALTPRRDPTPPAPRAGTERAPDPSRKTFVVPPSKRDPDRPELPGQLLTRPMSLYESWSPAERFGYLSGYPVTVPSSKSFEPWRPADRRDDTAEDAYAERLRRRVTPAAVPHTHAPSVDASTGAEEPD